MTHQPDSPFGCIVMWGPPIYFRDMGIHVCNLPAGHRDGHKCKCGAAPAGSATPTGDDDG
jgi:hypothetical protein